MGFWSKLGKIALKAAPIAAAFIPGVGPLASMAIGGATAAASKKAGGGSWKDALLAGGTGAAEGYGRGIGPSKVGSTATQTGWKDKLGNILGGASDYRTPPFVPENQGGSYSSSRSYPGNRDTDYINQDIANVGRSGRSNGGISGFMDKLGGAKGIAGIAGAIGGGIALKKVLSRNDDENPPAESYGPGPEPREMGTSRFQRRMQRELGPVMGQANQNNPNLALSIGQGRMDAIRDQPFRGGYDVRTVTDYDENDEPIYNYTPMPRIGPGRRRRQAEYYGGGVR
jgi:hypothetical protein